MTGSRRSTKIRVGYHLSGMLKASVMKQRRETVYRMIAKRHHGRVPCFVCKKAVPRESATLEHIIPKSLGGTDNLRNLSISHDVCNHRRGNGSGKA